jgi:hypothetical protein
LIGEIEAEGFGSFLVYKKLSTYFKILTVSVFVILVGVQADKSFVLDEIDFPIVSHATSQTLKPEYYRGESEKFTVHVGTYHPTLYINSLASFIKVFGFSETSVRIFGIICTLASAYLLILILRLLIKKNVSAEILLLGLYLLNPYTIANTTLPDIDSTILPVLILLFIYFSVRHLCQNKDMSNRVVLILGSLFALALWSKLTTPLILPLLLAGLAIITTKKYKESVLFALKVLFVGSVGFIITYFIYCVALDLSPTYTYSFLLESFTKGTSANGPIEGALNNLDFARHFVYWPTIPLVGLFGISFIGILFDNSSHERVRVMKLLAITGILVTIFYLALIAPFGGFFKYPFPVFGLLLLSIVFFYDRYFRDISVNAVYAVIALALGFAVEKKFWDDSMFLNLKPFEGLLPLLIIVIGSYLILKIETRNIIASLFVLYIFFCIGFQFSISRIQATAPYSTKYLYGQTGLDQTTAYLRSNTYPGEAIWSMKDVGYYTNNKYYESYLYYFDTSLDSKLINMLHDGKVRYYVVTTGIGQDNIDYYTHVKKILEEHAVKEKQFGNFIIYKPKE